MTEDIPSTRLKEMRKEVVQMWGRKASTEVSRCITSLKKNPKLKKKKPKIILERLQKGITADYAFLEKRSAESTCVNTFSGFLRVLGCLARQLVRENEQGLSCTDTQLIC